MPRRSKIGTSRELFDSTEMAELLAELDRLRAAADGLREWLDYMNNESDGLQFLQTEVRCEELGLFVRGK